MLKSFLLSPYSKNYYHICRPRYATVVNELVSMLYLLGVLF